MELKVAGAAIERTHRSSGEIDMLRMRLHAIEARHHALVSRPDAAARQLYERAVLDAWDQFWALVRLTNDDNSQQKHLYAIEAVLRRHLMDLDAQIRSIDVTPEPGRAQAVDNIDARLWDLIRGEQKSLDQRWTELNDASARNTRYALLAALLAIVSLISSGALILQHLRGRERAERTLWERGQ
jgi:hypothetical protein